MKALYNGFGAAQSAFCCPRPRAFFSIYIIINTYTIPKKIKNLLRFIDSLGSKACTISSPLGEKKLKEKKWNAPGYTLNMHYKRERHPTSAGNTDSNN